MNHTTPTIQRQAFGDNGGGQTIIKEPYSYFNNEKGEYTIVFHCNTPQEVLIALTDTSEKADFISKAANLLTGLDSEILTNIKSKIKTVSNIEGGIKSVVEIGGSTIIIFRNDTRYRLSLSKVSSEVVAEQPQVTGVEEAAKEMADAIEQTIKQSLGYQEGEYDVNFKYPHNNKAYQMLQSSLKKYKAIAGAAWQASQPTPPLPKLSAEEVLKKYRHDTTWLTREAYGKDKVIAAMQEYATTSPDNKLTDAK